MLTSFQWRWGVAQWVEFLKDKEIPVLLRTQALMQALASLDTAHVSAVKSLLPEPPPLNTAREILAAWPDYPSHSIKG